MLAIIIPYYKLTFFEATLESLADQTDKRFKVYIGDDASPENCEPLLEKYKEKFGFVYYRFENNLGSTSLTQQWERCILLSNDEEWLMILGDDDVLGENVVEEFYKQYKVFENKTNLVRYATQSINYIKSEASAVFVHPKWETAPDAFLRRSKGFTRSSLSEYVFSREKYNCFKFRNYILAWHSDDIAWLEFSDGKPIYSINESLIKIGISEFSLSGMNNNYDLKYAASSLFYRDIIAEKLQMFTKNQRLELMMEYEVLIKRVRKVNLNEWGILMLNYIKNFNLFSCIKLIRRMFISTCTS